MGSTRKRRFDKQKLTEHTMLTEREEQIEFVEYLRWKKYKPIVSANGGSRNVIEAVNLKRSGVSAGIPDVFVPTANKKYHGFFCELKRMKGGKVSTDQEKWIKYLNDNGYFACVAYGAKQAIYYFNAYINNEINTTKLQ